MIVRHFVFVSFPVLSAFSKSMQNVGSDHLLQMPLYAIMCFGVS